METPNILNVLNDPNKNIRYEVVAYRTLSSDELVSAVRVALSMMKKKPKRNSTYRFFSVIGHGDAR